MKKTLLIASLGFWALTNSAQTTFQTILKGSGDDPIRGIAEYNGKLVGAGYTETYNSGVNPDGYMVQLSCDGSIDKMTRIGNSTPIDYLYNIVPDGEGGYILTGTSDEYGGLGAAYMTRIDSNGTQVWAESYYNNNLNWIGDLKSMGNGVYIAQDGFNFVAGVGALGFEIFDEDGNLIKGMFIGGGTGEFAPEGSLLPTSDGKILIYGTTSQGANTDNWIIYKIDTTGNGTIDWSVATTHAGSPGEVLYDAVETNSGYYFFGQADFTSTSGDMFVMKRNKATGAHIYTKYFSGSGFDRILRALPGPNGSITIGGYTESFGAGGRDIFLANIDSTGGWNWGKVYGGASNDRLYDFIQTADGGYAIAGHTESFGAQGQDGYIIKTDANGNSGCNESSFTMTGVTATFPEFTPTGTFTVGPMTQFTHTASTSNPTITQDQECVQCDITVTMDLGTGPYCSKDTVWFINTTDCSDSSEWYVDGNLVGTGSPFGYVFGTSATYDVELEAYAGNCTDTVSSSINVIESPTADFSFSGNGLAITFTDNSTGNITDWDWDFGDSNTDNTQNPSHTYGSGGNYVVCLTVTDTNGCTNDTCITLANVGVEEGVLLASSLLLYPNPAKEQLNISLLGKEKLAAIEVMDITGKTIVTENVTTTNHTLNVYNLLKGLYIIKATSTKGSEVVKRFTVL